jgi:hypothetical protein
MAKLTGTLAALTLIFYWGAALHGINVHGGFGLFLFLGFVGLLLTTVVSSIVWGFITVVRRNRLEQ